MITQIQREFEILDSTVTDFTMSELLEEIGEGVKTHSNRVIAHHNLHSLYLYHKQPEFRQFYEETVSSSPIDGMPIIWMAHLYGYKIGRDRRLTYVDFLPKMMEIASDSGWRVFYLGSRPEVCVQGSELLVRRYPGIELRSRDGYFDSTKGSPENREIVREISNFKPDVLLVGMGMPRQEHWIAENLAVLDAGVILPCGAAIDYFAGAIPTPPRWAGRMGLEWFFRLMAEPQRLAFRYLIEPWYLLRVLARDLGRRK